MTTSQETPIASDGQGREEAPESPASVPTTEPVPPPFLDNRVIGWAFLAFVLILGLCIVFAFVYFVVVSMASPSFLNDYVKNRPDVPAQLTITLEYESRTMKTMGVQIAFGFLVGLVFAGIGVLLFAAGANGAMQLKSSAQWLPISLSATAPGLAVLVLGGVIIAIAVSKDVSRNMSAEMKLPGAAKDDGEMKRVISTSPHEPKSKPSNEPE